jgi:hypothetical protein
VSGLPVSRGCGSELEAGPAQQLGDLLRSLAVPVGEDGPAEGLVAMPPFAADAGYRPAGSSLGR